jgi:hypothetical protein
MQTKMTDEQVVFTVVISTPAQDNTIAIECSEEDISFTDNGVVVPADRWLVEKHHGGVSFIPYSHIYFIACNDPDFYIDW